MKPVLSIVFFLISVQSISQTRISGTVVTNNNSPVPGANVVLKNTYDGATADGNGNFQFITEEKGYQVLSVTFIGYKEFTQSVSLEGKPLVLNIVVREEISELNAVVISAGAFTASDESRRTVFRAVDIATTAGATADIAGALNTLPGTQKVGESGRLFVRGGDGREARTFIDGNLVLDAYGPSAPNTPSRGRFLPFMFKGTSFSTGGYSAEYGQALSSALVLDSKDETEINRTDIGIMSVGGDVAHTQAWERGSMAGKIQYTNLRPYMNLINQEIDWRKAPASYEGVAAFRQRVGKHGIVKAYGNFNHSNFSLLNHDIDNYSQTQLYELTNKYRYFNAFYKNAVNDNWTIRGGMSLTDIQNDVEIEANDIIERERGIHGKVVAEGSLSDHIELKSGGEVIIRKYDQSGFLNSSFTNRFDEVITSAFSELDLYANKNFVMRIGGRTEHNSLLNKIKVDPRISLAYKAGANGQVSFAFGNFRQSVANEYLRVNTDLESERSTHYILNYQVVSNDKTFRIEAFNKDYTDLIKLDENSQTTNNGSGYARGIELFWRDRKSIRNADYWISYSFLDTKRDYLNFPNEATPGFASKHNFSIVGKYFVQSMKSSLGATFTFASGRPYNDPNQSGFNTGKTPSYQDLSFNWSYLPKPYLIIHFSCTNLLGRDNIFGYEYSSEQNENGNYNGRAIRQAAPRFVFLGIFLTISKDKSVNQLPTL